MPISGQLKRNFMEQDNMCAHCLGKVVDVGNPSAVNKVIDKPRPLIVGFFQFLGQTVSVDNKKSPKCEMHRSV